MSKKITTEEFIKRARKVHGDKFDYSKVIYVNCETKVYIVCPFHDGFWQNPAKHLIGQGCARCRRCKKLTTEEFIERSKRVHGDYYIYTETVYVNAFTYVIIICPKHGRFEQQARAHMYGQGCKKCSYAGVSNSELKWLMSLGIPSLKQGFKIKIKDRVFVVDGYDPNTNTIYEYLGSFWHGNPDKFNPDDINPVNKRTFGNLYNETVDRINALEMDGYNVITKWGR